jgi:hypothetical protein
MVQSQIATLDKQPLPVIFPAMTNHYLSFRFSILMTVVLLAFGLISQAQAQPGNATALLNDAYATLAQAKHDYKGHRVKAMKQIELALGEAGAKVTRTTKTHEPQGTSDAQLRAAESLIQQAKAGLSGKALQHANAAIKQINEALSIR